MRSRRRCGMDRVSGLFEESIGLGSVILAVPVATLSYVQIKLARRQAENLRKQEENNRLTKLIESYVRPSNGRTTAQVVEGTHELVLQVRDRLDNHLIDPDAHRAKTEGLNPPGTSPRPAQQRSRTRGRPHGR